jgi:primosomal protein N' (replication factor Y)
MRFINRRVLRLVVVLGLRLAGGRRSAPAVVHATRRIALPSLRTRGRLPAACPSCGNVDLLPLGRAPSGLSARSPSAFRRRGSRIDRDSVRRRSLRQSATAHRGTSTFSSARRCWRRATTSHDSRWPVLGADNALYSADFRATERLAALLFQVTGRAGRADLPGEVIVQTDFPAHPLYRALAAHDYDGFAAVLLAERRATGLPPFAHLVLLLAEAPTRAAVDAFLAAASEAGRDLVRVHAMAVEIFSPVPASLSRRAGLERGQVLAQATERGELHRFLPQWRQAILARNARRVRWALDVDPLGFA